MSSIQQNLRLAKSSSPDEEERVSLLHPQTNGNDTQSGGGRGKGRRMMHLGVPLAFAATSLTAFAIARGGHKSGGPVGSSARDGGLSGGSFFGATLRGKGSNVLSGTLDRDETVASGGANRAMPQLGVQDQIETMKRLIVDTCGKAALKDFEEREEQQSSITGEKATDEDEDKQQGRFAKANAFLSKLAKKENGGKDDAEEEEEEDIDGEKNADKFVREFNDMQKTMKESTKTYAKGEPANAEEEEEEERFEKMVATSKRLDEDETSMTTRKKAQRQRPKKSSSSSSSSSSRKSSAEEEEMEEKERLMEDRRREKDEGRFRSDEDDEEFVEREREKGRKAKDDPRRSFSSASREDTQRERERLYERKNRDKDDDKSRYASKGARRMLLLEDNNGEQQQPMVDAEAMMANVDAAAEEEVKHTGVFALLQKMVGGEQSSQDPVKPGNLPQLGLPRMGGMNKRKKSAMKKKKEEVAALGGGKSIGVHVDEEDEDERNERDTTDTEEEEEEEEEETEQQPKKEDKETRTDKVLKLARDGEKTLEREAIEKVYKGDGSKSKKKSALEIQRGDESSAMSETDEEALEIENNAADKYYDVTKVERLAQETLKRRAGGFKGEASMGEQTINTKALEEAIGRAANQSPDVTRKELFSTLGHKSKEEFINAARLKKLFELKHIATTCKPTLADGGKAMERAKEAAQQAAMKVKQAAARRAQAEANYQHSQEVAKIAAQKVDDITELAQKKIQEVQEVAKRKVQNAKDISRLAGRKVEDEFDMLGKTKEDFNLHVQHAMKSVESAKETASSALEETKKKSQLAKQRAAALEVSLAKEYEEARTEREIEEKKLAKAEAQAEAAETEREQKVLEAHQRQMEIEKVAKERQFKLEEEQRQMEAAKKRAMAKSTQYRTSAEDALEKLSVIDFDNTKDSEEVSRVGFGEDVAYPDETKMATDTAAGALDGFDPWTK